MLKVFRERLMRELRTRSIAHFKHPRNISLQSFTMAMIARSRIQIRAYLEVRIRGATPHDMPQLPAIGCWNCLLARSRRS